jgi:hypothetical protein
VSTLIVLVLLAADPAPPADVSTPPPAPMSPATPAPYSVPFQLRVVAPVKALRFDNALELRKDGATVDVMLMNVAWAFHPRVLAIARLGGTFLAGATTPSANTLSNLMLGASWLQPLGDFRLSAFLGMTLPTATGGGNDAPAALRSTNQAATWTRNSMDNALFAANDMAIIPGIDAVWVKYGVTLQLELNVMQVFRVRGEAVQPDAAKTNLTTGLHAGYFVTPQFSVGAELRYQRWLSTPAAVAKDPTLRDNLNAAVGARFHVKVTPTFILRPGASFSHTLYGAGGQTHDVVQIDLMFCFL